MLIVNPQYALLIVDKVFYVMFDCIHATYCISLYSKHAELALQLEKNDNDIINTK